MDKKKEMESFVKEFDTFQTLIFNKIDDLSNEDTIKLFRIFKEN